MKAYIETLGCKVNTYESEFMAYLLTKAGYLISENVEETDVILVNTCSVTNQSDAKSRKIIRSLRRKNENAILIIMGCHIQNLEDEVINELDADIILGNNEKGKIIEYINEFKETKERIIKLYDMSSVSFEDMYLDEFKSQTRAFIKIEDGCNNFCSYCIIPYVRGRVRSKNADVVIKEVNDLVKNGSKEIVLTGIHTGMYKYENTDLFLLITKILENTNLFRLRISSIEIVELNDNILNLFETNKVLANHFHIPLQNGCDKILELMNRRYNKDYYKKIVNEIRSKRKNVSLTTDVIVGFPNETEEDFNETYNFCKEMRFSKIHVFPYSDRKGTVASKMKNHVKDIDKKNRVKKLLELSDILENEYYESCLDSVETVIIEEYKDGYSIGHTSNFIKVLIEEKLNHNEVYKVKLISIKDKCMIGKTM